MPVVVEEGIEELRVEVTAVMGNGDVMTEESVGIGELELVSWPVDIPDEKLLVVLPDSSGGLRVKPSGMLTIALMVKTVRLPLVIVLPSETVVKDTWDVDVIAVVIRLIRDKLASDEELSSAELNEVLEAIVKGPLVKLVVVLPDDELAVEPGGPVPGVEFDVEAEDKAGVADNVLRVNPFEMVTLTRGVIVLI